MVFLQVAGLTPPAFDNMSVSAAEEALNLLKARIASLENEVHDLKLKVHYFQLKDKSKIRATEYKCYIKKINVNSKNFSAANVRNISFD